MTKPSLYQCLSIVQRDALDQIERASKAAQEKPLMGWSQDKHDDYWRKESVEAAAVAQWCFIRMMQISPD